MSLLCCSASADAKPETRVPGEEGESDELEEIERPLLRYCCLENPKKEESSI